MHTIETQDFRLHYTLEGRNLIVRSGPFRWTIDVDEITGVEKASGFMMARSSPALSLDRLRIEYGRGASVMVSPRDRAGFMRAIEAARKQPG